MSTIRSYLVLALALVVTQAATSSHQNSRGVIGVILDSTSRAGKEARVSIEMALDDISSNTHQTFVRHITNSQGKPLLAALQARNLIDRKKVQAILGPHTWEEASLVAELANLSYIPTLSLAGSTPKWATEKWPFLIQASISNQDTQMKAVASIVQSYDWHRVTVIYEEGIGSASGTVIPNLLEALRKARAEISHLVSLPPFHSASISKELNRLKADQCRIFVVHTSLELAVHLFENANDMQMMEQGYIWITTNTVSDLFHSLNVSAISSMQGVIGIKTYFSDTRSEYVDFRRMFRKRFSSEYPEEENNEPGVSAVEAYDAMRVVALALDQGKTQVDSQGQQFLEKLSLIDFNGMAGRVHFIGRKIAPLLVFGVVNVIGKNSRDVGYWSEGLGFSKSIGQKAIYDFAMKNITKVIWPGEPWYSPRGWNVPTSLRVGVPAESMFKQFVNISYDPVARNYSCTGYAIEIFKETLARLPYKNVSYNVIPFYDAYDSLVEQINLDKFDVVVGDVSVIAGRCRYAEFTHPYADSTLVMIVPVQSRMPHKAWLFMKPFTRPMWALTLAITIYNGFVIWLIERNHNSKLRGSTVDQIGIMISLAFTTLFSLNGGSLHSNLSRLAMVVWLFVALVITQSYTASLTSMLTVQKLEPTVADIQTLKNNNVTVGYGKGAFVANYLEDVLGFKSSNIKSFSSPLEYAQALKTGEITAGFLNGAYVKLFLAKYCKSFIRAGPSYKVGGFGFAFPRGSSLLADVNEALLNVFESGKLRQLEDSMIGSEKCVDVELTGDEEVSLSLDSFWILLLFTGSMTTCALIVYSLDGLRIAYKSAKERTSNMLPIMFKICEYQPRRLSSKVYNAEISLGSLDM